MGVIARRGGVGGTVTLTSGLDPDDGVDEAGASVGGRAGTETSALDIAPVAPLISDVLNARATLVDDEVSREATAAELGSESL